MRLSRIEIVNVLPCSGGFALESQFGNSRYTRWSPGTRTCHAASLVASASPATPPPSSAAVSIAAPLSTLATPRSSRPARFGNHCYTVHPCQGFSLGCVPADADVADGRHWPSPRRVSARAPAPPPSLSSPGFGGAPPRFFTTTSVRGAWFSQRRGIALAGSVVPPPAPPPHRQRRPWRRSATGPAAERTCCSPGESSAPRLRPLWQCHSPDCGALAAAAAAPLGHWRRGGAAGDARDAAQPWVAVGAVALPTLAGG